MKSDVSHKENKKRLSGKGKILLDFKDEFVLKEGKIQGDQG